MSYLCSGLELAILSICCIDCIDSKKEHKLKWLVIISTSMNIKRESIGF